MLRPLCTQTIGAGLTARAPGNRLHRRPGLPGRGAGAPAHPGMPVRHVVTACQVQGACDDALLRIGVRACRQRGSAHHAPVFPGRGRLPGGVRAAWGDAAQ